MTDASEVPIEYLAEHEARHAIIAWNLGYRLVRINICDNVQPVTERKARPVLTQQDLINELLVTCAGLAVVGTGKVGHPLTPMSDFQKAMRLINGHWQGSSHQKAALQRYCTDKATALCRNRWVCKQIILIRDALLQNCQLPGQAIDNVLKLRSAALLGRILTVYNSRRINAKIGPWLNTHTTADIKECEVCANQGWIATSTKT